MPVNVQAPPSFFRLHAASRAGPPGHHSTVFTSFTLAHLFPSTFSPAPRDHGPAHSPRSRRQSHRQTPEDRQSVPWPNLSEPPPQPKQTPLVSFCSSSACSLSQKTSVSKTRRFPMDSIKRNSARRPAEFSVQPFVPSQSTPADCACNPNSCWYILLVHHHAVYPQHPMCGIGGIVFPST